MKAHKHQPSLLDKFIRDKHGKIATWQIPNLFLVSWFAFAATAHLFHAGHLRTGLEFISSALLFAWAYLEIRHGTSYFRRTLGLVVLFWVIASHFK